MSGPVNGQLDRMNEWCGLSTDRFFTTRHRSHTSTRTCGTPEIHSTRCHDVAHRSVGAYFEGSCTRAAEPPVDTATTFGGHPSIHSTPPPHLVVVRPFIQHRHHIWWSSVHSFNTATNTSFKAAFTLVYFLSRSLSVQKKARARLPPRGVNSHHTQLSLDSSVPSFK